jgi:phage gpG-like protein
MAPIRTGQPMLSVDMVPPAPIIIGGFMAGAGTFRNNEAALKDAIQTVVAPALGRNFDVGGVPPWTPLSQATLTRRANRGTGDKILVEYGTLKEVAMSMRPWSIRDNEAFMLANQLGDAQYGLFHDTGTVFMPDRPWSTLDSRAEEQVEEVFEAHVLGRFMAAMTVGSLIGGAFAGLAGGVFRRIFGK